MTPSKSWADKLKKRQREQAEEYARAILSTPTKSTINQCIPYPGVVLVMGRRRWGKTGVAHYIAETFHNRKKFPAVLHLPGIDEKTRKQVQRLLPKWMMVVTNSRYWPQNAIVIYDEAAQSAHARRTQSGDAVKLDNLIGISGQRNQLILFICHHSRKLDLNVIHECDRVIYKAPTQAHQIWERNEMADFTLRAVDFFQDIKTGKAQKRANLVVDFHKLKFYQFNNPLPSYWSDELSCLFQNIHI